MSDVIYDVTEPYRPSELIHIIWWQGELNAPDYIERCIESARKTYGTHRVIVWSGTALSLRYPVLGAMYDRRLNIAQIADMARLLLLKEFGGTYFDSDIYHTAYNPIVDDRTSSYHLYYQKRPGTRACINNAVIHCLKDHPYTEQLIDHCKDTLDDLHSRMTSRSRDWTAIGPTAVTDTLGDGTHEYVVMHPKTDYFRISWTPTIRMARSDDHTVKFYSNPMDYGIHLWSAILRDHGAQYVIIDDIIRLKV